MPRPTPNRRKPSAPAPAPASPRVSPPASDRVLLGILLLAALVRLALILRPDGQLGFSEHIALYKSWDFWNWGRPGLDLDPHTAGWPGLSFYLAFLAQMVLRFAGSLAGIFRSPGDFQAGFYLHRDWYTAAGQGLWTLMCLGGLLACFRWTERVAGPWAACLATLGLALDPLLLEESLTLGPDLPALAALWAALYFLLRYDEDGLPGDARLSALFLGLGISAKYYPVALVPAALWVFYRRTRAPGERFRAMLLAQCAGIAAAAFLATSPMIIKDGAVTQRDVAGQASALSTEHFGQGSTGPALVDYLAHALPENFGWLAYLAGVLGFAWLWRARPAARPGLVTAALCLLVFGLLHARFNRYILPVIPALWAGVGWLATRGAEWSRARKIPAWAGAGLLLLTWLALTSGPALARLWRPDTRAVALRDFRGMLRPDMAVLRERYTPEISSLGEATRLRRLLDAGRLSPRWADEVRAMPAPREINMFLSTVHPELSDPWYDIRVIEPFDLVLVSTGVSARYEAEPGRFPRQAAFYEHLRRYARPVAHWGGPGMSGPTIDAYQPDSARFAVMERSWAGAETRFPALRAGSNESTESVFHSELALLFLKREKWDPAVAHLQRAIALDSTAGEAMNNLALVYAQRGRNAEAEPLLARSLRLHPGNVQTELNLLAVEVALGHYDDVLAHLGKVGKSREVPVEALYEMGVELERGGRPIEAAAAYQAVVDRAPSSMGFEALGRVQESVGYLPGALDSYARCLRLGGSEAVRNRLGVLFGKADPATRARISELAGGAPTH